MEKIRKAVSVLRKEGVWELLSKTVSYFKNKLRYLCIRIGKASVINKLSCFQSDDPEEIFDFTANRLLGGFKPMQVREEFIELLRAFKQQAPKYIMEIGTANGGTLFCFSKIAPNDATLISIDLPEGRFGGGYPKWKVPIYRSCAGDNQHIHLLRADSHEPGTREEAERILRGNKLDFLFIDGDHSYEGVKNDFEMYSPLVRKGGMVAFHDIAVHPKATGCFVHNFWVELCKDKQCKNIIRDEKQGWAGIGVLFM